jgi:Tfp pilus assembly protein PilV
MKKNFSNRRGSNFCSGQSAFITLISVLIAGAVGLVIGVTLILLSLNNGTTSLVEEQSAQARALANLCAEDALGKIKADPDFASSSDEVIDFNLSFGDCESSVSAVGSYPRTIKSTGTVKGTVRRLQVYLDQVLPAIHLASWQELGDF